ncbi:putative inorganic phosphate transporter 1-8 [Camellia lanceoleosa]|nr:putative inorganic phosphate transporter 1-8 [Camellia lanceoleosa]
MRLIGRLYCPDFDDGDPNKSYQVPIAITSAMVTITLLGTVIDQLIFGYLGDRMGQRRVYSLALMCVVLSCIGCGFAICTSPTCALVSLGFFRFLLGMEIGGDYLLSTTIMSEKELVERTGSSSILSVCDEEVACYETATLTAAVVPDFCFLL